MILQISSGQGPAECELAVAKLFEAFKKEYPDITEISSHKSRLGYGITSVIFETEEDLSGLEGTVYLEFVTKSAYIYIIIYIKTLSKWFYYLCTRRRH